MLTILQLLMQAEFLRHCKKNVKETGKSEVRINVKDCRQKLECGRFRPMAAPLNVLRHLNVPSELCGSHSAWGLLPDSILSKQSQLKAGFLSFWRTEQFHFHDGYLRKHR